MSGLPDELSYRNKLQKMWVERSI